MSEYEIPPLRALNIGIAGKGYTHVLGPMRYSEGDSVFEVTVFLADYNYYKCLKHAMKYKNNVYVCKKYKLTALLSRITNRSILLQQFPA